MKKTMKAARLHQIGRKPSIDQVEVPKVDANEVLVDIKASGICHSDLNYRDGVAPVGKLPITLGHEIAGIIAEVGNHVKGLKEGERVCIHYVISCGKCVYCNSGKDNLCEEYRMIGKDVDGGFAEYIKVPARNTLKLPENIPFEQAAILGCAVSTPFHALRRGETKAGETVVIYGVGGLGVHAIQLASKVFGAGKIIAVDILEEKLKLAKRFGADEVVNAKEEDPVKRIRELTNGRLADVALDFVGLRETVRNTVECVGKGGRAVIVGISQDEIRLSPYRTLIGKEMELVGVNDHLKSELTQLIKLVDSRRIDLSNSVTHKFSLEEVNQGMETLEKNVELPIRVVIVQ